MNTAKGFASVFLLSALALLSWAPPAQAATGSALLHVQATVRPYLQFSATQPAASYQVTAADIRRGHVDLPRALTIRMKTNIREEVRFDVSNAGPERVLLKTGSGLAGTVRLAAAQPAVPTSRTVDMRIVLPPGTREGRYPLQVALLPMAY